MSNPTDRSSPAYTPEQVDEFIAEAFAAVGILPTHDRCSQLNDQLRAAIGQLADQARQQMAGLEVRSRDWYARDNLLVDTDRILAETMGSGLRSAALHVAALGRHCAALRDCLRETP